MTEMVTIPKETAQRLFDALAGSMDFGSGMLETDDVEALRALAIAIGVDPNNGTPAEFAAAYPHTFDGQTDRERVAWQCGALTQTTAISVTGAPYTVNTINEAAMPAFVPCKVGPYGRWCNKPADDPIHQTSEGAAA